MVWVFLDLKDEYSWLTSDYHLSLILGTKTRPFTQVVLFFPFIEKKFGYLQEWKTNTWACKLLQLGFNVQTMIEHFTYVVFFFWFIVKRRHICILAKNEVFMTYKRLPLGHNTWGYEWTFHQGSLFLSLLFEMVKV